MKAKKIPGQAPGGKRTPLGQVLPLDTPYVVQIFPIYACNFRCNYCIFSIAGNKRGFISDQVAMSLSLLKKAIRDMTSFPKKIKVLRFVGIGEPLLHKNIVEMIEFAAESQVADTIELLTNGALLTRQISDRLLKGGLNRLVVSIQGTSSAKYKQVSNVDINFDSFLDNLRYFNENRGKTQFYIKTVDSALDDADDEQKFYDLFGDLCETIAVEHTVPIHSGVAYDAILQNNERALTQFGIPITDVPICPQPFFTMQINPDGNVVPCFSFEYPEIIANCHDRSVFDIWNGKEFNRFRRKMLDGKEKASSVCINCDIIKYRFFPEDDIRNDAARLKKYYE